ncbi:hypothetical protein BV22DRAFT_940208 [Leucogyrophana mollusca]|uniref:Uncharacterized protein n=1 Tax=Leucogyrophana mollusca TaxID=85980 RepID=A0ACB8AUW9_9AGAM|nr:hypothetical protein BV22DRAFT_940208 [Leucogyrophana mollusca]
MHLALPAFRRAATFTLGSIAFGPLIVALLEILRLVLNTVQNNAGASGGRRPALVLPVPLLAGPDHALCGAAVKACLACCAGCFVGCIESMVKCSDIYAYIEIALYGKSCMSAVRDTWNMFKDGGIEALDQRLALRHKYVWSSRR